MANRPVMPWETESEVIRWLRSDSNTALFNRDVAAIAAHFADDIHAIFGGGVLVDGRDAVTRAYAEQLRPGGVFLNGQRQPQRITVHMAGAEASEPGHWFWTTRTPEGDVMQSGDYLARWVKHTGVWRLQSETYVTTGARVVTGPQ